MSAAAILFTFAAVLSLVLYFWKMRRYYYASIGMSGPIALPFVGNYLHFIGSTEDIMQKLMNLYSMYKSPIRVWFGTNFTTATTDPEDYEILLNDANAIGKQSFYRFFTAFMGNGLFTIPNVATWRQHRKLLAPTFNLKIVHSFVPIFEEQSWVLCEILKGMAGKGNFDVYPKIARCTLDIICETAMGTKVNAQTTNCDVMQWIDRSCSITYHRIFNPLYQFDWIYALTKEKKELDELGCKISNFTERVIQTKREALENNSAQCQFEDSPGLKKTFLDYLLDISKETGHFTNEEIRAEVQTFISAGSDTSAGTESYVLMMLGMHPEVQAKAIEEQNEIFGDNDRAITSEDLAQMKYLERVIKETLRLFPVGPVIARAAGEDLKFRTYTIPKGTTCTLAIFQTHRNPKIWKDPLKFDPDRFLPEEIAKRHPYSWIPFSAGPRNCIGLTFAMVSMKVVLSSVLRRYEISCPYKNVEDIRLKVDLVLKTVEGFNIALELRK